MGRLIDAHNNSNYQRYFLMHQKIMLLDSVKMHFHCHRILCSEQEWNTNETSSHIGKNIIVEYNCILLDSCVTRRGYFIYLFQINIKANEKRCKEKLLWKPVYGLPRVYVQITCIIVQSAICVHATILIVGIHWM